jgi:hypothetical protein
MLCVVRDTDKGQLPFGLSGSSERYVHQSRRGIHKPFQKSAVGMRPWGPAAVGCYKWTRPLYSAYSGNSRSDTREWHASRMVLKRIFFRKFADTRYDITWFVEQMQFINGLTPRPGTSHRFQQPQHTHPFLFAATLFKLGNAMPIRPPLAQSYEHLILSQRSLHDF